MHPSTTTFVCRSGRSASLQVCLLAHLGFPRHSSSSAVIMQWRDDEMWDCHFGNQTRTSIGSLPASAWLIGLGHLGQAFLWTLGLLPYGSPEEVSLVLQDFDELVEANDSTSLLTTRRKLGVKKTRAMALWCESRGFRTSIIERRFGGDIRGLLETSHALPCVELTMLPPEPTLKMSVSSASLRRDSVLAPMSTLHFRLTPSRRTGLRGIVGERRDTNLMRMLRPTNRRTAH